MLGTGRIGFDPRLEPMVVILVIHPYNFQTLGAVASHLLQHAGCCRGVIENCLVYLGKASLRFYHRLRNAETGADIASLSQFGVHLDLDSHRPSCIHDHLRERFKTLVVGL